MDGERIRTMLVMSPPRAREGPDTESLAELTKQHGLRKRELLGWCVGRTAPVQPMTPRLPLWLV
jgi:hypothetical protein